MHKNFKRALPALIAGSALIGSLALAGTAFAAAPAGVRGFGHGMRPAVVGTVASAPNASGIFTVTAKNWARRDSASSSNAAPTTTYTVDTTGSTTVTKAGAASTVSAIAVGDTVMVQGTLSGSTVSATVIRDGVGRVGQKPGNTTPRTPAITGNGEPVIGGTVTVNQDGTLTVTTKSGISYAVTVASSATIAKPGVATATIANVVTGDSVVVQGTVNGTSVTASSIVDQGTPVSSTASSTGAPETHRGGFMGAIGGFFSHLFGFF
ncbi:MAG: hypothetical protein ACYC48_02625 [Minisyncoccota bacterium]